MSMWTLFTAKFQAYELCVKKDLLREQVFVLGRMGNAKQALAVIINKLGDIEEVIVLKYSVLSNLSSFRILCNH